MPEYINHLVKSVLFGIIVEHSVAVNLYLTDTDTEQPVNLIH